MSLILLFFLSLNILQHPVNIFCLSAKLPHILFIVADDYGWNDVEYHQNKISGANPDGLPTTNHVIRTPMIDRLQVQGRKLENYYVQPLCSPTRGTIMTGRYPSHTGIGPGVIKPTMPYAMPKKEIMIPELLKKVGYATHMVGKWHLGYCHQRYLPTVRGFDSFLGYLNGEEEYFKHMRSSNKFHGLDFRNGTNSDDVPPPLTGLSCEEEWCYSTYVFAEEVSRIVQHHAATIPDTPLFVYMPFQAIHAPLEAPPRFIAQYANISNKDRRLAAAMIAAMDEAIGNITYTFEKFGLWNDTLLIFTTDNGGPIPHANNYPLRGHKATNWEGGVRGTAFVRGTNSKIARVPSNSSTMELMHTTDWLPTLANLVGASMAVTQPLDGVDQWSVITTKATTKRTAVIHNVPTTGFGGAIRVGDWKLMLEGMQTELNMSQTPPPGFKPGTNDTIPDPFPIPTPNSTKSHNAFLFNIATDPTESINLAASKPDKLQELLTFFLTYQKTAVNDLAQSHSSDPQANPHLRADKTWGPFTNSTKCKYV